MSSDVQPHLGFLQMNDYVSVATITAVIYDYFLNFSREVDYVWCRSWTWVSTIFVVVRYIGLTWAILGTIFYTTFVPDSVKVSTAILLVANWGFPIFLGAADLVMILRVYAMWHRSKRILYILLFIFIPPIIVFFVFTGIYNNPNKYLIVTTVQVSNFSICKVSLHNITLTQARHVYNEIPRFFLSVLLLILAAFPTLKQSIEMYKATKQWQPNKYMQQLVGDGIVYFVVNVAYNIVVLQNGQTSSISILFLGFFSLITITPMMPRFIISVRELYDRDRGYQQGIDTGFGVLSQPVAGENAVVSAIVFAAVNPGQEDGQVVEGDAEDSEGIRLELLGDGARHV
ncbi:hypothetical protein OG21DRAFT_1509602 [Imleria badia]|nr:hypothetical protein OG21DRAFT_1509602 [Imleria badia]